jgi:hypothetical protein
MWMYIAAFDSIETVCPRAKGIATGRLAIYNSRSTESFMPNAIVRIWPSGHASVQLGEPHGAYITWRGGDKSLENLRDQWGYLTDLRCLNLRGIPSLNFTLVEIPLRQGDAHCGLDKEGMLEWWERERRLAPPHRMLGADSSYAIVVSALRAGGAEVYVKPPFLHVSYTLVRWANDLSARIQELQKLFAQAMGDLLNSLPYWRPNLEGAAVAEVFTLEAWKRSSSAGSLAVRREQVAAIDNLLAKYHGAAHADERPAILYDILALALDHLKKKPDSPRRPGMIALGRQVYDRIQELEQARRGLNVPVGAH